MDKLKETIEILRGIDIMKYRIEGSAKEVIEQIAISDTIKILERVSEERLKKVIAGVQYDDGEGNNFSIGACGNKIVECIAAAIISALKGEGRGNQ